MSFLFKLALISIIAFANAAPQVDEVTRSAPTLQPPTLTVNPTLTIAPTATIGPVRPTECICPGRLLCCRQIVGSEDPAAQGPLDSLGVVVNGTHIPIGLSCTPYDPRLVRIKLNSFIYDPCSIFNTLYRSPAGFHLYAVSTPGNVGVYVPRYPNINLTWFYFSAEVAAIGCVKVPDVRPTIIPTVIPTLTSNPTFTVRPSIGPVDPIDPTAIINN